MEPWITRNEINKRTQLPVDDEPGKFIKKKRSSESTRPRIPLPKNSHIFEEIKYSSDYDSDWQPNYDEITADIQALNGGPLCTDAMLVNGWKQKQNHNDTTNIKDDDDDDNNNINIDDILDDINDNKKKIKKKKSSRRRYRPLFSNNVLMRNLVQKDETCLENIVEKKMKNLKV